MTNCVGLSDLIDGGIGLFPQLEKTFKVLREFSQKHDKMFEAFRQPLIDFNFGETGIDFFYRREVKKEAEPEYYDESSNLFLPPSCVHDRNVDSVEVETVDKKSKATCVSVAIPAKKRLVRCNRNAHNQLCMGVIAQTVTLIDSSFWLKKPYKHSFLRFLGKTLRYKSKKTIRKWLKDVDFDLAEQLRTSTPSEKKKLLDTAKKNVNHEKPSKSCGRREHDKMSCRVIAKTLWFYFPKMKISQVCRHDAMLFFGNALRYTGKDTIRGWIKDLALNNAPGRPKKTS